MLDIQVLRKEPDRVRKAIQDRQIKLNLDEVIALDDCSRR